MKMKTMKTKKLSFLLVLMATVALSGCTNDSDTPDNNSNFPQDGVMRFATSVTDAQTRTGYDDSNVTTQDLYLWATPTGDNPKADYTYKGIILHHTADGGWGTYSTKGSDGSYTPITLLWQDKTTPVKVVASSFGGNTTDRVDLPTEAGISVSAFQREDNFLIQSDFLYFSGTVNPALTTDATESDGNTSQYALVDGKIRLPMRHINSKLNLTLTLGTEFNASADGLGFGKYNPLTDVKVNNVYGERQFNMTTGEFGAFKDGFGNAATPSSITLSTGTDGSGDYHSLGSWAPTTDATKNAVASYECILLPQTVAANTFTISFTLGGKAYKWTSANAVTLESGKAYTLSLTAGKEIVTVKSLSATAWDEQTEGSIATE